MKRILLIVISIIFLSGIAWAEEPTKQHKVQLLEQQLKTLEWEAKWHQERLDRIFPNALQDEILKLQKRVKIIQGEWPKIKAQIEELKTYEVDVTEPPK